MSAPTRRRAVDVTEFGADPTGTRCSAAAVAAAIASVDARAAIIRFPRGRYSFEQENATTRELYVSNTVGADPRYRDKRIAILLEEAEDLELDGDGSTFIFHGTQTMIAVLDSRRVRLTDVELDFARPTVIDATVVGAGVRDGRAYREISVPTCTAFHLRGPHVVWVGEDDPEGIPYWEWTDAGEYCQVLDPRTGRTIRVEDPVFADVAAITAVGRRIRLEYSHDDPSDDVGAVYQYRQTTRDHPGIAILDSADTELLGLQVRFLHGFGVVAQNGLNLTVSDCTFAPPSGGGRVTAGFADFLQCSGMSGHVAVRDTTFRGAHDDPINIHGTYLRVPRVDPSGWIELEFAHPETAGFPQFSIGDLIEIVDADLLRPVVPPLVISEVRQPSGRDHGDDLLRLSVRVDGGVPPEVSGSPLRLAVENITRSPSVVVERCRFGGVPTRGILVTARGDVRIADSIFERLPMPSIFISADAAEWWESGPVRDVEIEGNHFVHPGDALLEVGPGVRRVDPAHPVHGRIVLRGNTVESDVDVVVARARSVAELRVTGTSVTAGVEQLVETEGVPLLIFERD